MKHPHLAAVVPALALFGIVMGAAVLKAVKLERRFAELYVSQNIPLKVSGSALLRAALTHDDLLPVIGASEILKAVSPYRSGIFFQNRPTGFAVFEVARGGAGALSVAQQVAGLGESLRGKKVVMSFTPTVFEFGTMPNTNYARNFSALHTDQMLFSSSVSMRIKRTVAQRLLHYKKTLRRDLLVSMTAGALGKSSHLARAMYYALLPLGKASIAILSTQDHLQLLSMLWSTPRDAAFPRKRARIDWNGLAEKARAVEKSIPSNNPFGFDRRIWTRHFAHGYKPAPAGTKDAEYIKKIDVSSEWADMKILLSLLRQYGANVLLLSRPLKGQYYDAEGISFAARRHFYDKLQALANGYHMQLVDFRKFDDDIYFGIDRNPHTAHEGWIYVDRALDAFYHGTLAQ